MIDHAECANKLEQLLEVLRIVREQALFAGMKDTPLYEIPDIELEKFGR
jgi:hypothetical protein